MENLPQSAELAGLTAAHSVLPAVPRWLPEREARRDALEALVAEHARLAYRVAYAVVRNAADAEDAVQETYLQLLRGSGRIEDERAYLARAAWRAAVRIAGRRRDVQRSELDSREAAAQGPTPEQAAMDGDFEAWVHKQLDAPPEKLRQPLALAALGELSGPEIARVLRIPEGTARRRIHTARQMLKERMEMERTEMRRGGRT